MFVGKTKEGFRVIKCFEPDLTEADYKSVFKILKSKTLAFGPAVEEFERRYKKYSNKKIRSA